VLHIRSLLVPEGRGYARRVANCNAEKGKLMRVRLMSALEIPDCLPYLVYAGIFIATVLLSSIRIFKEQVAL
jgi:hypothetical protein